MAVSGVRTFNHVRYTIIKAALRKLGVVAQGEDPTPEQYEEGDEALNTMVQAMQTRDVFLWTRAAATQALVEGTASYTVNGDDIIDVENFFIRDDSDYDHPVEKITKEEYDNINVKDQAGRPEKVYVDKTLSSMVIYTWPVCDDDTDVLHYSKFLRLQDFTINSSSPDFPVEWSEALIYNLAVRLAPEYRTSIQEQEFLGKKADAFLQAAIDSNNESVDVQFCPSFR